VDGNSRIYFTYVNAVHADKVYSVFQQQRREVMRFCLRTAASVLGISTGIVPVACRPRRENSTEEQSTDPLPEGESIHGTETSSTSSYLVLHESGELKRRGQELWKMMKACELCPRRCGINRIDGGRGFCGASARLEVASYTPHFGEEKPLVGRGGSGTIFFTNCSLRCVFCINWEISQGGEGTERSIESLSEMMLSLQKRGCGNINVVTPTHYSPHIVLALDRAAGKGLQVPFVYNTCGWERLEILQILDGVVDIYLPDYKYSDGKMAAKYSSSSESYPEITAQALLEMHRQVGVAHPNDDGSMERGLMVRHLVMPNDISGTKGVIDWIADNLPADTWLNLMSQYTPYYKAHRYPEIARRITREEYTRAVKWTQDAGLTNVEFQGYPM
jgi:putative pyruvate formate lyase activating enzyme